jgi:hypothetical protein
MLTYGDNGDYRDNLDDTGADQTLAIMPRFDVSVVKSEPRFSRAYNCMLANARGAMAYSFHVLNSTNGEFMEENSYPNSSVERERWIRHWRDDGAQRISRKPPSARTCRALDISPTRSPATTRTCG